MLLSAIGTTLIYNHTLAMNKKYDIYISYSRSDYKSVLEFSQNLQLHGFTTWMNMDPIINDLGIKIMSDIIEDAKIVLFFSSTNSNKSSWVEKEICTAIDMGKSVIVIKLDDSLFNPTFSSSIKSFDAYDCDSSNSLFEKLVSIIDEKIKEDSKWVFISHSTNDFKIVRLIRNALEKTGRRPILFYLKCLSKKEEVTDLLKREIDARPRFILCDSENARKSPYVREEVDYIKSKNRMYETINLSQVDLDSPYVEQEIVNLIKPFERRTTVFLSYSRNDQSTALQLRTQLIRVGFDVWDADFYFNEMPGTSSGQDWSTLIKTSIKATLDKGYFVALLGDRLGDYSIDEIKYANEIEPSRVLPVSLGQVILPDFLKTSNILDVSSQTTDLDKAKIITDTLIKLDLTNNKKKINE